MLLLALHSDSALQLLPEWTSMASEFFKICTSKKFLQLYIPNYVCGKVFLTIIPLQKQLTTYVAIQLANYSDFINCFQLVLPGNDSTKPSSVKSFVDGTFPTAISNAGIKPASSICSIRLSTTILPQPFPRCSSSVQRCMICPQLDNSDHDTGWVGSDSRNIPTEGQFSIEYFNIFVRASGSPYTQKSSMNSACSGFSLAVYAPSQDLE